MDRRAVKTAVLLLAAVCILAACGEKEEEENRQARIYVTLQDAKGAALPGGEIEAEEGREIRKWVADDRGNKDVQLFRNRTGRGCFENADKPGHGCGCAGE